MGYKVHKYYKPASRQGGSTEQKIVENIFKGLWWIVSFPFRLIFGKKHKGRSHESYGSGGIDRSFVETKWQEIEQLMRLGRPSNFARAVLEADKLLDHILKGLRAPGLTMGDRLKASKNRFSPEGLDAAWRGHKIRNELVHNSQYEITDFMAREAISNFKKAIGELV
ncbi:MAG: hypothetical protein M1429_03320 [Patescibacteria group bacterium]|nr:hypothetical protein [Patescibacteria group bacterium]